MRRRATVVVERDGKVLLVLDKGSSSLSLPGGGVNRNEPSIAAAARELYEETGLVCTEIRSLFRYRGSVQSHRVFRAVAQGEVRLRGGELSAYIWWDGKKKIKALKHVTDILGQMGFLR